MFFRTKSPASFGSVKLHLFPFHVNLRVATGFLSLVVFVGRWSTVLPMYSPPFLCKTFCCAVEHRHFTSIIRGGKLSSGHGPTFLWLLSISSDLNHQTVFSWCNHSLHSLLPFLLFLQSAWRCFASFGFPVQLFSLSILAVRFSTLDRSSTLAMWLSASSSRVCNAIPMFFSYIALDLIIDMSFDICLQGWHCKVCTCRKFQPWQFLQRGPPY